MPLDRSSRLTDQSVVMESPDDIGLVFDALRRIPERGFFTRDRAQREIAEEIAYQCLVHPDWIRPHVAQLVRLGAVAAMDFEWQCRLMDLAPDALIADLIDGLRGDGVPEAIDLLLASRHPAAMAEVADIAQRHPGMKTRLRDRGFHLPPEGPAVPRFTTEQCGVKLMPDAPAVGAAHAVGLPLAAVVAPGDDRITFHYASLTPAALSTVPAWDGQAHIIAVRSFTGWTAFTAADQAGRLSVVDIRFDNDRSLDDLVDVLDDAAVLPQVSAAVELLPYDDQLTYANQHPFVTAGVFGVLGGPPMGLSPAPECPKCAKLMFHVAYVDTSVREYGDGFRSLFICEDCRVSATLATLFN